MGKPITSTQWMHSCYDVRDNISFLTVKEKTVTIDPDTNEVLKVDTNLKQITDPKRKVYITKPEYRTHRYKKESEEIAKCNCYSIPDRTLVPFLQEKLFPPDSKEAHSKWMSKKKVCSSPYVYGVDITVEALARHRYEEHQVHHVTPITMGSLDIESSMLHSDKRTNCITVICDRKIYTAALEEFMWKYPGGNIKKEKVKATLEDFNKMVYPVLEHHFGKLWTENNFEIIAKVCLTEEELYRFIFNAIQEDEPDYIFAWNMGYDVPQIIKRMESLNLDPRDYFCSKALPKSRQYLRYYEDKKQVSHIVLKWNWLHCTSMTQWLDAMALYGQVRKQKPKESSYSLTAVMENLLGVKKLDLEGHSHQYMQEYEFIKYWIYNIADALLVQLGGWKTKDYDALYQLTEHSTLMDFAKQTVMLCNDYHWVLLDDARVFATTGASMTGPYDHLLNKVGGAVLDAKNVVDMGVKCIAERPNDMTNVLLYVADDDYEALYPNWKIACAIAKENKSATLVSIDGMDASAVEPLSSALSDIKENAVWIGSTYFHLSNFTQMEEEIRKVCDEVPF